MRSGLCPARPLRTEVCRFSSTLERFLLERRRPSVHVLGEVHDVGSRTQPLSLFLRCLSIESSTAVVLPGSLVDALAEIVHVRRGGFVL